MLEEKILTVAPFMRMGRSENDGDICSFGGGHSGVHRLTRLECDVDATSLEGSKRRHQSVRRRDTPRTLSADVPVNALE
jgi:hypothetical protein